MAPTISNKRKASGPAATTNRKRSKPSPKASLYSIRVPVINQVPRDILDVFISGCGEDGELGLGPELTSALHPHPHSYLQSSKKNGLPVVQLACGGMHTVALTNANKLVTWGVNDNCALGRDTKWDGGLRDMDVDSAEEGDAELNPYESVPRAIASDQFPPFTNFVQVAAGDSCSLALTDTGRVYGWGTFLKPNGAPGFGYDSNGKLIKKQEWPTLIPGLEKITQIACGANHALALDQAGKVWAWGAGEQNQLGRRLFGRHQDGLKPRVVGVCRNKAKYIAAGEYHSFAIDQKDNVWAWGLNSFGEAGYVPNAGDDSALAPYPIKIADLSGKGVTVLDGGAHHSAAVTSDGKCLVWGRMDGGQLGINFSDGQLEDETLIRRDQRNKPRICLRPTEVPALGHLNYVACGPDHTIFVNQEGQAFATGFGAMGQLGLGSEDDADVAQEITANSVKDKVLSWAGAGGQYSVLTALEKLQDS